MSYGSLRAAVRRLVDGADMLAGLVLVAVTVLNLAAVFMRYVMLDSISWSEEMMRYGAVWVTFLAAAGVSLREEHLSLELFRHMGGPAVRRLHDVAIHLLAACFAAVVLYQGVIYCLKNGMQTSPTVGMPMVFAYGALAVGGALLLLAELAKAADVLLPAGPAGEARPGSA
ncbi:MAG: TRAP transporter small permease [Geminicoccaceae bacterium]